MDSWRGGLGFGYHGSAEGRPGLPGNKQESGRKVYKILVIVASRLWPRERVRDSLGRALAVVFFLGFAPQG